MRFVIVLLSLGLIVQTGNTQPVDPVFRPFVSFFATVRGTAFQPDGKILVAGAFSSVGNTYVNGLVRLNSDGALDGTFKSPSGYDFNGLIQVEASGKIVVGVGEKYSAVGSTVIRLNSNGTRDKNFSLDDTFWNVLDIARQSNGEYIIVSIVNKLSRVNANGVVDPTFDATQAMTGVLPSNITIQGDGKIVVFGKVGSGPEQLIGLRLSTNGSLDNTFSMTSIDQVLTPQFSSLAVQDDGKILLAGTFTGINSSNCKNIIRLNTDGSTDNTFVLPGPVGNVLTDGILSVALTENNILVGGSAYINSIFVYQLIGLRMDGSIDQSFPVSTLSIPYLDGISQTQISLSFQDSKVLVGANFSEVNGIKKSALAMLDDQGILNAGFEGHLGGTARIGAMVTQPDGKILVGGNFTGINGNPAYSLARLNPDGSLDQSFQQNIGVVDNSVLSIELQPDGKILVGGDFTNFSAVNRPGMVRLNSDGTLDNSFNANVRLNFGGYGVAVIRTVEAGKIVIGGAFAQIGATLIYNLARLNPDGSLDIAFNKTLLTETQFVNAVGIQTSGKLIIGGRGIGSGGFLRRTDEDGIPDAGFSPNLDLSNQDVKAIQILPDDRIIFGGYFSTTFYTNVQSPIFQLSSDGNSVDNVSLGIKGGAVSQILSLGGNVLLLSGEFKSVNDIPSASLAVCSLNGSVSDLTSSPHGPVLKAVWSAAGPNQFYLCGSFTSVNSIQLSGLCRINLDAPFPPKNLTASTDDANGVVDLTWDSPEVAVTNYVVWRSGDGETDFIPLDTLGQTFFLYTDTTATALANFSYAVTAFNSGLYSDFSNIDSVSTFNFVPPDAPADLHYHFENANTVTLGWTDKSNNELSFEIERKKNAGDFTLLFLKSQNITSGVDNSLSVGDLFSYRVRTSNKFGKSAYSNELTIPVVTGIEDRENGLTFYPNPVQGYVTVVNKVGGGLSAELLDLSGRSLLTRNTFVSEFELDLQTVSPGVYILKMSAGEKLVIRKLIKK